MSAETSSSGAEPPIEVGSCAFSLSSPNEEASPAFDRRARKVAFSSATACARASEALARFSNCLVCMSSSMMIRSRRSLICSRASERLLASSSSALKIAMPPP
eukprot:CAMPEP_0183460240 /NCGR_PEP_ID=MMETSP0370-20130417/137159_1 /TAXON_ID=268820 /ORGANISM="Peridinium aciculiferum, Strain PAER-2" /LENGTH=102 /DNA_ID=CAMNT_0025652123 /DNA_START=77 /DNA_END=381 /DNA_ORIENTATION=+